jgi:membrane protein DedA with SNARE-associated domain
MTILQDWGLLGLFILMGASCALTPVPGEMILIPTVVAYIKGAAGIDLFVRLLLLITASTLGSYAGGALTYWGARLLGRPLVIRYGKYFMVPEHRLRQVETLIAQYGNSGIFFGRLLPVLRRLIGIPAGIARMSFKSFTWMMVSSSLLWSVIFTLLGVLMAKDLQLVIGQQGAPLSPAAEAALHHAYRNITLATILIIALLLSTYIFFVPRKRKGEDEAVTSDVQPAQAD